MVAFGDVTDPATVPSTGTATYSGVVQGWYSATPNVDPTVFRGDATVTVNFATRQVTITVANTKTYDATQAVVPATFTATTTLGAAGASTANYMTGTVDAGTLKGGISGRYSALWRQPAAAVPVRLKAAVRSRCRTPRPARASSAASSHSSSNALHAGAFSRCRL